MATTDDGKKWAAWLRKHVAARGAGGRMKPADLLRALESRGVVAPSAPTVSRWLEGQRPGSADLAGAVGDVFGERAAALHAAGYADPVGTFTHLQNGNVTVIVFGGDDAIEWAKHQTLESLMHGAPRPNE